MDDPARADFGEVAQRKKPFRIPHRPSVMREHFVIAVEVARPVGDARVGETEAELVVRARRERPLNIHAAVRVEIDQVAVIGTSGNAGEHADATVFSSRNFPHLLLEDTIDAKIGAQLRRHGARVRIGLRQPIHGETLISEQTRVIPAAELDSAGP
jgi:hypothetical protein